MQSSKNLFLGLAQFNSGVVKRMDANLSIHGISFSEYHVLHCLAQSPKQTLPRIELARLVGLSASGVTRMLAPMEKIGLVQKESHPRDARMSLVRLTESGASIYEDASTTADHVASAVFSPLSEAQRETLEHLVS